MTINRFKTLLIAAAYVVAGVGFAGAETYPAVGMTDCIEGFSPVYSGHLITADRQGVEKDIQASCIPESSDPNVHPNLVIECSLCKRD